MCLLSLYAAFPTLSGTSDLVSRSLFSLSRPSCSFAAFLVGTVFGVYPFAGEDLVTVAAPSGSLLTIEPFKPGQEGRGYDRLPLGYGVTLRQFDVLRTVGHGDKPVRINEPAVLASCSRGPVPCRLHEPQRLGLGRVARTLGYSYLLPRHGVDIPSLKVIPSDLVQLNERDVLRVSNLGLWSVPSLGRSSALCDVRDVNVIDGRCFVRAQSCLNSGGGIGRARQMELVCTRVPRPSPLARADSRMRETAGLGNGPDC